MPDPSPPPPLTSTDNGGRITQGQSSSLPYSNGNGQSTAPPPSQPQPQLPDREWETSPMYLALSARLQKTESTLSSLSAQVSHLTQLVKSSLPPGSSSLSAALQSQRPGQGLGLPQLGQPSVFSPFEDPDPAQPSPFIPSHPTTISKASSPSNTTDTTISALTTQIAALSTSVAQLQRLQQSQAQLTRQSSNGTTPTGERPPGGVGAALSITTPTGTTAGIPFNRNDLISGPLTTPNGPNGNNNPLHAQVTGNRPNMNRSISSSVIQGGAESGVHENNKWGPPPKFTTGLNNTAPGTARDWSPGPGVLMTPNGGAAAPGAGIVVTKWDHLNLKMELLRSIAKYGIGPPNKIQARVLPFMLKGSDIIAQAPPTQERIISYVIPAIQLCLTLPQNNGSYRGPSVVIITTTVDQATQCHKLVRNVGSPLGIRSALATGAAGSNGLSNEIAAMQRDAIQLLIGTPAKISEVLTTRGGINGSDVRLLILDEVDQLIARNLYEFVLNVAKVLPTPRRGGSTLNGGPLTPNGSIGPFSPGGPGVIGGGLTSPYDAGMHSPFNPASKTPFPSTGPGPSRFGALGAPGAPPPPQSATLGLINGIERQTCIFSNTIPTDVINFSQQLQVRDPVRVLVRREGGANSQESVSSVTPGINLKHTYVYLTITGSARSDAPGGGADIGPGTIGSGRSTANGGQASEESNRAKEYKLDMLIKILDDYPLWQAIIHVGTFAMLEAVVYKLQGRQWETLYLTSDMPPAQKKAVLQQWRLSLAGNGPRFLVNFDVSVKPPEIPWSPLVINFDLPRSVEGYAHRAAAAVPPTNRGQGSQVNGVIVSFVQAAGGDVEMLRSTECAYRFKSAEIPTVFHDLFQH